MDKFRLATRFLSVGLGAFRRAAVAPPPPAAARYYSTGANYNYVTDRDYNINFSKMVILYGGSILAVEGFKYLIDYGGYKDNKEKVGKLNKELEEECALQDTILDKLDEKEPM